MKSFFSKKIVVGALVTATVCVSGITDAKAQEFAVQGDIVSSYVWRGMYQGGGAAFQPTLGFGFDNFSVTAWGCCFQWFKDTNLKANHNSFFPCNTSDTVVSNGSKILI